MRPSQTNRPRHVSNERPGLPRQSAPSGNATNMMKGRPFGAFLDRRRHVGSASGRYSRFVGLMKLVLPMSAVTLVVLVIAWPYLTKGHAGLPISFSSIEVDDGESIYMTNARYFGSDANEQPFTVVAEKVNRQSDDPDIVQFTLPKAEIQLDDGRWIALAANRGTLYQDKQTLTLDGAVSIFSDEGYEFHTERAEIDLHTNTAYGRDPVEGEGPLGLLNAEGFRLDRDDGRLRFEGGVRLVLQPASGS
jgi:lipopolysaccharide export system protein LptC